MSEAPPPSRRERSRERTPSECSSYRRSASATYTVGAEVAMLGAPIVTPGAASAFRSVRRCVGLAAAGTGLLLVLAGSAFATRPTAALPQDLPEHERVR